MREWLPIVNERPDDAPHTLIIGTSGTGKTTLAQALTVSRTGKLAILDPKWTPGRWGGLPAVAIDDNGGYTQIEAAIKVLLEELTARLVSLKQGVSDFDDLTIIAEELPTLVDDCPSASTLFKKIGRLGRELRIRLVGLSQSERVKSLGIAGEGDAKDNYTLIRLGKAAIGVVGEARTLPYPAVLEWRGEYYLMELGGILHLSQLPIPAFRYWPIAPPETVTLKHSLQQHQKERLKKNGTDEADSTPVNLQFSVEEIGSIASLIVSGVDKSKAVRAMPRYNRRQHKGYVAYYERLRQGMNTTKESKEV